ncbi:MAG: MOSC domain-containing protein, partial [Oleibacter sp.]|nr:MOSC domain-containing protein [Thalassolituus sp.]
IVDQSVHGGIDQAVYMYHSEDYQWWSEQLGKEVVAGSFGENLTLSGLADIDFNVGDRLTINNVVLEITAPRVPCFKLSSKMGDSTFLKKFVRAERPGAYARVIQEGSISAGDTITFEKVSSAEVSLKDIFVMWHSKDKSPEFMQQVLASSVASVHREKIQTWLDAV